MRGPVEARDNLRPAVDFVEEVTGDAVSFAPASMEGDVPTGNQVNL
jgi:hypothetical protein